MKMNAVVLQMMIAQMVGDDWTGTFIRGDNAGWYALLLRQYLDSTHGHGDVMQRSALYGLVKELEASREH